MKVLVVGSGGREHALAWALVREGCKVLAAPGNPGIASMARCFPVQALDIPGMTNLALSERVDLVVVGPEAPLAAGLADSMKASGVSCFGPGRRGARIESSKWFAKEVMLSAGVPTAEGRYFTSREEVFEFTGDSMSEWVLKADGLAAGKGVFLPADTTEASQALGEIFSSGRDSPGVVVERRLSGREASVMAICNGRDAVVLPPSRDHKRAYDGDQGPNTGGMGAVCPPTDLRRSFADSVRVKIIEPILAELASRGIDYRGVLYAGMIVTADGPFVLEFNCRFGDPETQSVLPRISSGLSDALMAAAAGGDLPGSFSHTAGASACVVLASGGYPGDYSKGHPISGLESVGDAIAFHAGTAIRNGKLVTDGGRVLGITALGDEMHSAISSAYAAASSISFEGCFYRKDIGRTS
jgi:phosphoribosylamine--glycine ligase